MSKKTDPELMKLDLYEILEVPFDAEEKAIKKSFRKKVLTCHPDKNKDNPNAASDFDRLKKILLILLDPGARAAYDKVLKARKAAAIRARESNAKSRKLKEELDAREAQARAAPKISDEERLRRELERLDKEGEELIAEEMERINKLAEESLRKVMEVQQQMEAEKTEKEVFRVKAKWKTTDDWPGYTKEDLHFLFYKWGDIGEIVSMQKGTKGTALIEYKDKSAADMAVSYEKGMPGKAITMSHIGESKDRVSIQQ